MNLNEMGEQEKSVALARLCGWRIDNIPTSTGAAWMRVLCDENGNDLGLRPPFGGGIEKRHVDLKPTKLFNLYDPANMALAWRVGVWAGNNLPNDAISKLNDLWLRRDTYPYEVFMWYEPEAQRLWLDKILELAIEAGMTETP